MVLAAAHALINKICATKTTKTVSAFLTRLNFIIMKDVYLNKFSKGDLVACNSIGLYVRLYGNTEMPLSLHPESATRRSEPRAFVFCRPQSYYYYTMRIPSVLAFETA